MTPLRLPTSQKSRLRLIVIQALVFSLFATLFVRLYYLQVVSGEKYQGKAAAQSVRDIVVQPQRGLIVDAMGRPLVANRMSWVVSIDRTMLDEPRAERAAAAGWSQRVAAHALDSAAADDHRAGWPTGTARRTSRCRWPRTSDQKRRAADPRAARGLPGRGRRAADRARLPAAVRHQRRPRPRLPEPDHRGGVRPGQATTATARSTARRRSAAPASRRSTTRGCAACPATAASRSTRWAGSSTTTTATLKSQPGDTLVTSIDARVQSVVEKQLAEMIRIARATRRPGDRPQLRRRLRRRGRDGGRHRPDRRDGQPADVRPVGLGRRDHPEAAARGSTRPRRAPRCSAGPPRASSRPGRPGSRS